LPALKEETSILRAPVVISDGEARSSLAATRSLGASGYEVHVLSTGVRSLAGVSRYAAHSHQVPPAASAPDAWCEAVEALLARLQTPLFLPTTEIAAALSIDHGLCDRWRVALPDSEAFHAAVDKHSLLLRARELEIDVPQSTLVEDVQKLVELPSEHQFPVILKARRSRWFENGSWKEGGVRLVRDDAELQSAARDPGFAGGCLIQEFIPGHGEGLFFLADRGRIVARFAHQRLREKPPSGGISVLCKSVTPDPALLAASERLLAELHWHGVAMVEYRRSPTGRAVLMEINPRLWGSLQLAIDSGVDFPRLMVELHSGERVDAAPGRSGGKLRWLFGDFDHLFIALRRQAMRAAVGRTRLGVIRVFIASFFDGSRLEVLRRDDLAPFFHELRERIRGLFSPVRRRR